MTVRGTNPKKIGKPTKVQESLVRFVNMRLLQLAYPTPQTFNLALLLLCINTFIWFPQCVRELATKSGNHRALMQTDIGFLLFHIVRDCKLDLGTVERLHPHRWENDSHLSII